MGRLIGAGHSENYGEKLFVTRLQEYLDDTNIIYWNRQVFGREFDVCILMPEKGILVVEVKGWREENILRVKNNEAVLIRTDDGEVSASPQKQARGYRFSIERYIRQSIGKFPLVYQMVCLPQVTKAYYRSLRLDVVMEERFTILKEDLADNTAFFNKLDQALREVNSWKRTPFDCQTMLEVRSLFETDIDPDDKAGADAGAPPAAAHHSHDYSRFYYLNSRDGFSETDIKDITEQYLQGCKLYCVFSSRAQLLSVAGALDAALSQRGLVRDRDNIAIAFDDQASHSPQLSSDADSFMCFHCSMSVLSEPFDQNVDSFIVRNGKLEDSQKSILRQLGAVSQFNAEQYLVEHAAPEKNIVIRAGAGTGKTYTMISRIGFICYAQKVPLRKMAKRIVMITFTNEAADQMSEKLRAYFRNCYLVTSCVEYLDMISQISSMQISTIHSYAKKLIAQLGTSFGYGIDVDITSSEFYRRRKISDILDDYIHQKRLQYGADFTDKLGLPVYAIRDSILDFIGKLHNKSIDIGSIEAGDFGLLRPEDTHGELHALLAAVIPAVEREYDQELLQNNRLHLSSMMSILNRFISRPESEGRIRKLKEDKDALQFLFVDEFQDTDDTQIESLLMLARLLDYRMFLVGDIKQCIYRFRGAKEKAFDQLKIHENPSQWLEFSLQRNYRTDTDLLNLFDLSFSSWGARPDELLTYDASKDRLIGTRDYNGYISSCKERFFRKLSIENDALRIPALVEEIRRLQKRIQYEEEQLHRKLSPKERSIAILVRENWQAEMVRTECARLFPEVSIQTNTGGDLYMSQPALDMMILVNALVHFDEADYLYNLATSSFFGLDIPKSNLFALRRRIRNDGWKARVDEREQVNYLIRFMNTKLAGAVDTCSKWEYIVAGLRTDPVLQVLHEIYNTLEPWRNFSEDPWKQHYYQLNVDLLFEQLIQACNVDRLTINTLQERLSSCIVSQVSVDSRIPASSQTEIPIQCVTVHKAKGLEYGHVILPFCSAPIDMVKKSQLHISTEKDGDRYRIGYSLNIPETGAAVQNTYYDEHIEKAEKSREEARVLYVAMTRAMRSFSWIEIEGKQNFSWQNLIETEA
ncbi:MAG: UvrD-helicase domain-containing protein [Ruminococcus sp.]|nr:UvrD-helicase domain-containing protein [Ruminococcus sp.]